MLELDLLSLSSMARNGSGCIKFGNNGGFEWFPDVHS
jgi:hypothetical protein